MIYKVMISEHARMDLRRIYEYIALGLHSPQNAFCQLKRLEERITKLDQMPERFRVYEQEPWYTRGLRIMPVDNFVVLYIPDKQAAVVNIVRVMYGGQDIDSELKNNNIE